MASILFMSTREKGHVFPLLGPAQWLLRLGHRVAWLCLPSCPDWLERMGIEPVSLELPSAETEEFVSRGPELAALERHSERQVDWII